MVEEGFSAEPSYSADGKKILFISRARPGNRLAQVYEKDLETGVEKRITYQNGNCMHPRYTPKEDAILYASSTDELKENPPLLNPTPANSKLPYPYQEPMEIYLHSRRVFAIDRLTTHFGFDGEAHFIKDGREITFTRADSNRTQVLVLNRATHSTHVLKNLGTNPTQYVVSPDGQTQAWIDWDESFGVARLRVQKGKAAAVEVAADAIVTKTDLAFTPDSKWLLWAQRDAKLPVFDLYAVELATMCRRRLTTSQEGERRDPVVSPDMKWLTYTWVRGERSRIARAGFAPPTGTCPPAP